MSLRAGLAEYQSFAFVQSAHIAPAPTPGTWRHTPPEASRFRFTESQPYSYSYEYLSSCSTSCSDALSDPDAFCSVDDLSCLSECPSDLYFLEAYCACNIETQSNAINYDFYGSEEYCCGSDECQSAVLTFYGEAIGADATDLTSWLDAECSGVSCHSPTPAPSTASTATVSVALSLEASTALPSTAEESTLKTQIATATGYPQSAITNFAVISEQIARRLLANQATFEETKSIFQNVDLTGSNEDGMTEHMPPHLRTAQFHHSAVAAAAAPRDRLALPGAKAPPHNAATRLKHGHSVRKLATYEWVVSFDLTVDLADHSSLNTALDFAASVSEDLSSDSFATALVDALPGVVSSVNTVTASVAHTRKPTLAPVSLPAALPTAMPQIADDTTAAQGSALLLLIGCIAGALLLIVASLRMRHVLNVRHLKAEENITDVLANASNGDGKNAQNRKSSDAAPMNSTPKRNIVAPPPSTARLPGRHVLASTPLDGAQGGNSSSADAADAAAPPFLIHPSSGESSISMLSAFDDSSVLSGATSTSAGSPGEGAKKTGLSSRGRSRGTKF